MVGPSEKASLGGQTGGSANKKKKSILKIQIQFDMFSLSYEYKLMSQDSREKFGVRSALAGAVGGGQKREKGYVESRTK